MCVHVRSCMGRWKRNEVIKWCVNCCVQSREEMSACMCFLLCRFLPPIANHIDKVQSPAFLMAEFQEDNAHTFYFFSFPPLPLLFSIHPLHNGTVPASSTSANADELSAAINKVSLLVAFRSKAWYSQITPRKHPVDRLRIVSKARNELLIRVINCYAWTSSHKCKLR